MLCYSSGPDLYLQEINATVFPTPILQDFILNLDWGHLTLFVHKAPSSTSFDLFWDCQGAAVLRSNTTCFCVCVYKYTQLLEYHINLLWLTVKRVEKNYL